MRVGMVTEAVHHRFTVDEYLKMGEAGILTEDDRVELIDGEIIQMSPISNRHVEAVNLCAQEFAPAAAARRVKISVQNPVRVDAHNVPQPDVVLVRPGTRGAPRPADVLLVIEVAITSLGFDRRTKLPLYARAGIPETWLLDVDGDGLEAHQEPGPDGYALIRRYRRGQRLAPQALPDVEVAVDGLLPPPDLQD